MTRNCAICGSSEKRKIYSQVFVIPSYKHVHLGYDVVICDVCGFSFADNLADQSTFDKYYQYSYTSSEETARYQNSAENICRFLQKEDRILDIGCGTGHLLNLIRLRGHDHVYGLEPSVDACHAAKEKYGLDVVNGSLFDNLDLGRFDFIILSHVLEHIVDLPNFILQLHKYLKRGGRLYIEVPDVHNFLMSLEPNPSLGWKYERDLFAHFAPEHINFFSMISLQNLMTRLGFEKLFVASQVSIMGVVTSVWREIEIVHDREIKNSLDSYIEASNVMLNHPKSVIKKLVETQEEIIVWGAGLHTQRLLGCSLFGRANIKAFIDQNPRYNGELLVGKPIITPSAIIQLPKLPIVISSRRLQGEIKQQIQKNGIKNPLILLYPEEIEQS